MPNGITNLYDWETAIEDGFACALLDQGIETRTLRSDPQFQEVRPRVELLFRGGPARQSYGPSGYTTRNASWTGRLEIQLITNTDTTRQTRGFRTYRAYVRSVMETMRPNPANINNTGLNAVRDSDAASVTLGDRTFAASGDYCIYHKIQNIIEEGADQDPDPDKGIDTSKIYYRIDFGIDGAAWAELTTNP